MFFLLSGFIIEKICARLRRQDLTRTSLFDTTEPVDSYKPQSLAELAVIFILLTKAWRRTGGARKNLSEKK